MNLYTIVTNDEYEFPIKCDIRVKEVAAFLQTSEGNVRNMVFRPRKRSKYKVVVSGKVEFNQNEYNKTYALRHDRTEYFKERYKRKKEKRKIK